jgi:hypothetical protein
MDNQQGQGLSQNYAFYVAKEVVKAAVAYLTDDMRRTLGEHLKNCPPGCQEWAQQTVDLLSEVEVRYYNEFDLPEVFAEVLSR